MKPYDLSAIRALATEVQPVGSRVTCDPPPMNTDEDFLVLVSVLSVDAFDAEVKAQGFVPGGSDLAGSDFRSFKRDAVNLIVTADLEFFSAFMAATSVAKRLNLLDKADRIALFQAVLYGKACEPRPMAPTVTVSRGFDVNALWASITGACGRVA